MSGIDESESASDRGKREAELIAARRANLAVLRSHGVDPFAATRYEVTAHAGELASRYTGLGPEEHADAETWKIAGRVMSLRGPFADLSDRSGRFQLYFAKKELGEQFALLKALDRGDFLGASGFVFRTKMGDLALQA